MGYRREETQLVGKAQMSVLQYFPKQLCLLFVAKPAIQILRVYVSVEVLCDGLMLLGYWCVLNTERC